MRTTEIDTDSLNSAKPLYARFWANLGAQKVFLKSFFFKFTKL